MAIGKSKFDYRLGMLEDRLGDISEKDKEGLRDCRGMIQIQLWRWGNFSQMAKMNVGMAQTKVRDQDGLKYGGWG